MRGRGGADCAKEETAKVARRAGRTRVVRMGHLDQIQVRTTINRFGGPCNVKPRSNGLMPDRYNAHMRPNACFFAVVSLCLPLSVAGQSGITPASAADRAEAQSIFKQLIETNTTDTARGNVTAGTEAMEKRFLDAGFPREDVHLLGPNAKKMNLVVRYRAAGTPNEKPVLFLCHMDVVEALKSDWHTDPFQFVEKDGYWYGRGTQDMKDSDAGLVATFLRLHREGYKPKRDLILALTADEEGGKFNGASWLVNEHRDLVDAAYVINPDSGGVELDHGRAVVADVEATEKVYADFQVTATDRGGHSSLPRPDNAIYELSDALEKLAHYSFPFELNEVTRTLLRQSREARRWHCQAAAASYARRDRLPLPGNRRKPSPSLPHRLPPRAHGRVPPRRNRD